MKTFKRLDNKIYNSNGITLLSLVITIIILLILAAITLSLLSGPNGIIQKTVQAKESWGQAQQNEINQLAGLFTQDDLQKLFPQISEWVPLYTREHLEKIASNETLEIDGSNYTFSPDSGYIFKNDIDISNKYWNTIINGGNHFSGVIYGNNKKITGLTNDPNDHTFSRINAAKPRSYKQSSFNRCKYQFRGNAKCYWFFTF